MLDLQMPLDKVNCKVLQVCLVLVALWVVWLQVKLDECCRPEWLIKVLIYRHNKWVSNHYRIANRWICLVLVVRQVYMALLPEWLLHLEIRHSIAGNREQLWNKPDNSLVLECLELNCKHMDNSLLHLGGRLHLVWLELLHHSSLVRNSRLTLRKFQLRNCLHLHDSLKNYHSILGNIRVMISL